MVRVKIPIIFLRIVMQNQQNSFNGNSIAPITLNSAGGIPSGDNYRNYNATFAGHRLTRTWHNVLALHHQNTFCHRNARAEPESGIEIAMPQGESDRPLKGRHSGLTEWLAEPRVEVNANTLTKA